MGRCYNSAVINAPCQTVWEKIRNFHDLAWAAGVVTKTAIVGDLKGDQIGAKRILNDVFHETLLSLEDEERTFSYRIDDGPGPVAKDAVKNYVGAVRVLPITENNTTFVEWQSTYESADDRAVGELCNPIYQAVLQALKNHFS
ncbi:MAG: SRPBCC family protein [Nitrospirota bacterium]|nr:SRPBCC family protein [Nitrospirota bacterium]